MGSDKQKNRPLTFEHTMQYDANADEYSLWLVHKKRCGWKWLWLLLLLLPLLLLIKCEKDVVVTCVDADNGALVSGAEVTMSYTSHFVWNNGRFFPSEQVERSGVTDENGQVVFEKLPCSVFSYIFYAFSNAEYSAVNECHAALNVLKNFHYRKKVTLDMDPYRETLRVRVLDRKTGDVIPGATVRYRYSEKEGLQVDSVTTDVAGIAEIPGMRVCSTVDLEGSCYGYEDDERNLVPCRDLLIPDDSLALRLNPVMESFSFFVKNAVSKEPIPAAECLVTLSWPNNSNYEDRRYIVTSIDGRGTAFCDSSFVLSTISILAHKPHYRDSTLAPGPNGPWRVIEFRVQDDDTRTVWLEPEPFLQEFVNRDSLTHQPIPGVVNKIRITNPDGTVEEVEEVSNSNGVFPVTAREDAKVEIISEAEPGYKPRETVIPRFSDVEENEDDRTINMEPEMETLVFRTIRAETGALLPDCSLAVSGSISGRLAPYDSGSGQFSVSFRRNERLTIRASKRGFTPTTDKVNAQTYDYLVVSQDRRDIPLKLTLPPCNGGNTVPQDPNSDYHECSYYMGKESGIASVWLDFDSVVDEITIYDSDHVEPGKEVRNINHLDINYEHTLQFEFGRFKPQTGIITVVVIKKSTYWKYQIICPN